MFGASSYTIDYAETVSTQGKKNSITYRLINVKVPQVENGNATLTSGIALALFKALDDSIRKKYPEYNIGIENDGVHYNQTYSYNDLGFPSLLMTIVDGFFEHQKDTVDIHVLDHRLFPDSVQTTIQNAYDSLLPGNTKSKYTILGFQYQEIPISHEVFISYWIEANRKGKYAQFLLNVSTKTDQIIFVNINKVNALLYPGI